MTDRRPRVLVAWELGANFGHVSKVREVVLGLGDGVRCTVVARDPAALRRLAPDLDVALLAAPHAAPRPRPADFDYGQSYPDDLRHCGWHDPTELAALVEAWRTLIALVDPALIVAQAAPTALLAARGLGVPTAMVGSGYDAPPRARPMPPFLFWVPARVAEAPPREAAVVAVANQALARHRAPPIADFADILATDVYALATFAEIDHYGPRAQFEPDHGAYLGQLVTLDSGAEVAWLPGARRRLLAYLWPGRRGFDAAIAAFQGLDPQWDVVLAAPGADDALRARLAGTSVRVVPGPVRLERLLPDCDLGISHASNGIAAAFVLHGVPQIGLPTHAEQAMLARALARGGLGLGLMGTYGGAEVMAAIDRIGDTPRYGEAAARVGAAVRQFPGTAPGPAIATLLRTLL